ncbi:MAG: AAA domain-containing protein [Ignavibacteria bacterium]|nr:AAA domain-containing protein [Ignavibacteria bacterium]
MKLISKESAESFFDIILEIHLEKEEPRLKIISLKRSFDELFREITRNENTAFTGTYARIEYVIQTCNVPQEISDRVHQFRKHAVHAAKGRTKEINTPLYLIFLKMICRIIEDFSDTEIPKELAKITGNAKDAFKEEETRIYEKIDFSNCIVLNKTDIKRGSAGTENFSLYCEDTGVLGRYSLRIYRNHFEDLDRLHENISRYSALNILNINIAVKEKYFYSTNYDTQIILEPDFIVEASDIAECFASNIFNPNIFFIRKLIPSMPGLAAFKGNLVNGLMDALIADPQCNPEEVLEGLVGMNLLKVLYFGKDAIDTTIREIQSTHYKNIADLFKARKTNKIRIEPTFISPLYGIHGRLDALIESEDDASKKNIFELKSGHPKNKPDVWENHKMQVTCYNMLLKSAYGKERKGTSSILYSATDDLPFRNVLCGTTDEKKVLSVRNSIVSGLFNLADNSFDILSSIVNGKAGIVPRFMENTVLDFSDQMKNAGDADTRYYRYMLSFVLREHRSAKTGNNGENSGFASLWTETIGEKEKDFKIISNLILENFEDDKFIFNIGKSASHNFRDGDIAVLYKKITDAEGPLNSEIIRGTLQTITNESITVVLRNRQVDSSYFAKGTEWIMEHDVIESNFWNTVRLLFEFVKAPKLKRDLILGLKEPKKEKKDYVPIKNLSKDQNENIEKAIKAEDYFLLQGPPGTGKTSTALINIIKKLLEENTKIVLLAYTNRAVEEICANLKKNEIDYVRSGKLGLSEEGAGEELIPVSNIFVSTVTSFVSKIYELERIIEFDTLIIDEASQLTEADIAGILPKFRKFILIGDQNQLPSVVTQEDSKSEVKDETLRRLGITNFNRSLFERLYKNCIKRKWYHAAGMLETHYRMHKDISKLINRHYGNKLKEGRESQTEKFDIFKKNPKDKIETMLSNSRTIFIESAYERTSKTNRDEAVKTVEILKTIKRALGEKFTEKTVGVVTPYRAQIALIKSLIDDEELREKVTVDTVERFQGSERDIIIVSFAVYNTYQLKNLQSLNSDNVDRKLLVTLSRASEQIILLGYELVLKQANHYSELIEFVKTNGKFVTYAESKRLFKQSL